MPRNGNRHQRGYGTDHDRERARWVPVVARGDVVCWRCGRLINPAGPWDLGHLDDRSGYAGPEHRGCNRSAGARVANQVRRAKGRQGMPKPITSRQWW